MSISERKKKILAALVEEHIRTAEPVGSKVIARIADLGCSSATIRNELSELTSMGYLEQPHTSAGRVPTPAGYRIYVNELMHRQKLSLEETEEIERRLNDKMTQLDSMMSDVGKMASQLTDYPSLMLTSYAPATIKRFDLIYIDANTFIIVAMLSNNTVKNKLVHLPISVDSGMIAKLSSLFNANFTGISNEKITPLLINSTERAADDTMGLTAVIASFAMEILAGQSGVEAFVTGENRLLSQPEFRDPDKAHRLMSYLSDGGHLISGNVIDPNSDFTVLIGPENVAEELKDSSVVIASYDMGDNTKGLIGVVGPTRMDYSAVAAKLSFLAAGLSKRLGGGEAPPSGMHTKLIIKGDDIIDAHCEREKGHRPRRGKRRRRKQGDSPRRGGT